MRPEGFVIVVPAKDEAELIGECLRAIITAIEGVREPVALVLVAHRYSDATEAVAGQILSGLDGLDGRAAGTVVRLDSGSVAAARSVGAMAGLRLLAAHGLELRRTWLLSTDADSRVPPDWIDRYRPYLRSGAAAVTGMVRVTGWEEGPPLVSTRISRAYQQIVSAGLHGAQHDHVYGANLAVRADAYLQVGGWPDQVPGEDAALVETLRRHGALVTSAPDVIVSTSGRVAARAPGGLGDLLATLAGDGPAGPGGRNARIIPRQALRSRS